MNISLFLAKMLGLMLIIECAAALYKRKQLIKMLDDAKALQWLMLISGIMACFLGLLIVLLHNIWILNWQGLITLLGWLALFKGIARIFAAEQVIILAKNVVRGPLFTPLMVLFLGVGAYLAYIGFLSAA